MEKVRPLCGQPSDRGRLKNRREQSRTELTHWCHSADNMASCIIDWRARAQTTYVKHLHLDTVGWGQSIWAEREWQNYRSSLLHISVPWLSFTAPFPLHDRPLRAPLTIQPIFSYPLVTALLPLTEFSARSAYRHAPLIPAAVTPLLL